MDPDHAEPDETGVVTLAGLTIRNGSACSGTNLHDNLGGGVLNYGNLTVSNCVVTGNHSQSYLIQSSTDAVNWVSLGTCRADARGDVQFTDANTRTQPLRYYRAVEQ